MIEMLLDVTETESEPISPRQLWHLGIDIYVADVTLQWRSPGGLWVDLGSYSSVGRWQLNAASGDTFRVTTTAAGSRVWVTK